MHALFPHKIDRYRIIQQLVKAERMSCYNGSHQKGIDQAALARKSDNVSQTTISNLEHLAESIDHPKRSVSRQDFLKVLTHGMRLEQKKIDAILWLYDDTVLTRQEIDECVKGYQPDAIPKSYTYNSLRNCVVEWLTKALNTFTSGNILETKVKSIYTTDEDSLLQSIEALYEVEKIPGHCILVCSNPPFLIRPGNTLKANNNFSKEVFKKICAIHEERRKVFLNSIEQYGYWSIHQKSCIERYLSNDLPYKNINLANRQSHIQHWIELLKTYPGYEVGLAEAVPDTIIINKCNAAVVTRATPFNMYPDYENDPFQGLRFTQWMDNAAILQFFLDCEKLRDKVPVKDRTKNKVIAWLEHLLNKSHHKKNRLD